MNQPMDEGQNKIKEPQESLHRDDLFLESEYYLLLEYAIASGFKEYSHQETTVKEGLHTTITNVVQGFFVDSTRTQAIISNIANKKLIPHNILRQINNLIIVDSLYEGYEYLLVKCGSHIFTFNIQLYYSITEVIRLIDLHVDCKVQKVQTNKEGTILVLDTGQVRFLISGMLVADAPEVERSILMSRLEDAKPFFEFTPVKKVDWSKLKDNKGDYFEKITETLLQLEPNLEVNTLGKTNAADRGRDFIVIEKGFDTFGNLNIKKWLVQCKFSEKSISPKIIPDWVNRSVEHDVDGYWLITNNDVTPDLFDQLQDVAKNKSYKIETRIWQRNTFDVKLAARPEVFKAGLYFNI
jgi:hypothetical protein